MYICDNIWYHQKGGQDILHIHSFGKKKCQKQKKLLSKKFQLLKDMRKAVSTSEKAGGDMEKEATKQKKSKKSKRVKKSKGKKQA